MPKFKYVGGKKTPKVVFGVTFGDKPVAVEDEHIVAKLRGNRFFEEAADKK